MPTVRFINDTQVPLHVCLKQVSPLHYSNSLQPGGKVKMRCGSVWFTVQARIDRGDNGYDRFQTYAPIAAITLCALTLGAGAIYIAGASAAAGGATAAVAALSARISALVAMHSPTARRLYKYAQKGQTVAKVGQVIGIGGGALTGANKGQKPKDPKDMAKEHAEKATRTALKKLLQGSVLSSPGWYINRDRTLRIVGGPRASRVDGLLVIETDTTQPFAIVDETGKTVATGNQDGGEKVPATPVGEAGPADDDSEGEDNTEDAAQLKAHGPQVSVDGGVAPAAIAATAPAAPAVAAQAKKDSTFMRLIKGDKGFA
ncbi:uncharacterized protein PFL1_00255 [Pseudozyma flocculosa PF-1]|uniref:Uncharacterized protein n=1 Tax=Pseudozyma flocculosa TaxID=84751 RepID=A0A5C3ERU1_9BASI|nr:uncharacterized protein PFL1_00255 [Pseudozyma flocculosa PF-1]EPQ32057.1 hypothetical protein PFL1_00255 [Pseudozyma flocculosa PF-1]SPO35014.1 uncharacterized protein PSFLO_00485 [Pseudozyma flocculosa]